MPIFDFKCKCGCVWRDHMIMRGEEVKCPKCGELMEKEFPTQINFKMNRLIPAHMPIPRTITENPNDWLNEKF